MKRIKEINEKGYTIHLEQGGDMSCDVWIYFGGETTHRYCKCDCDDVEMALQKGYEFVMNQ